jgi:hypothetical protein
LASGSATGKFPDNFVDLTGSQQLHVSRKLLPNPFGQGCSTYLRLECNKPISLFQDIDTTKAASNTQVLLN